MKLSTIKIQNFLGIRHVDLTLGPITLIAGLNGSGKSSIENAVRLALTGMLTRVDLKRDIGNLVHEGQKQAEIEVLGENEAKVRITANGKAAGIPNPEDTPWWAHALCDMRYLAQLDATALRRCLFTHSGGTSVEEIEKRLLQGGGDPALIGEVKPLLRSFDAAAAEATSRAQTARGEWKGITGEVYGSEKAENWQAQVPEIVTIEDKSAELRAEVERLRQAIADARATATQRAAVERQLADARQGASLLERREAAVQTIQKQVDDIGPVIAELERKASGKGLPEPLASDVPCPECGSLLHIMPPTVTYERESLVGKETYDEQNKGKPSAEAKAKLKAQQEAKGLLQRSLDNAKRDLAVATAAAGQVATLDGQLKESSGAIGNLLANEVAIGSAEDAYADHIEALGDMRSAELGAKNASKKTKDAAAAHAAVKGWLKLRELLSPDGVQAQFLDGVLKEFNDRLRTSAERTQWGQVQIHADMSITYGGRALALCSESERWRGDAVLTEAVAFITKERFLMADRLDVLSSVQRLNAMDWARSLEDDGVQCLLFCTLKGRPGLANVTEYWLENGSTI